ncbi:MAG: hypothetical protein IPL46_10055 [Saprospiraceae bacterium]|nr:hypothetical protein [Saprospiraceae bacterium]
MKLRLKDNTMRIRLSMTEVDALIKTGQISATTVFPGSNALTTEIVLEEVDSVEVSLKNSKITISIPSHLLSRWNIDSQVGHQWQIAIGKDHFMDLYLEKDFRCLTERRGEDQTALYPNPGETHG